jgi:hypothetical protein
LDCGIQRAEFALIPNFRLFDPTEMTSSIWGRQAHDAGRVRILQGEAPD